MANHYESYLRQHHSQYLCLSYSYYLYSQSCISFVDDYGYDEGTDAGGDGNGLGTGVGAGAGAGMGKGSNANDRDEVLLRGHAGGPGKKRGPKTSKAGQDDSTEKKASQSTPAVSSPTSKPVALPVWAIDASGSEKKSTSIGKSANGNSPWDANDDDFVNQKSTVGKSSKDKYDDSRSKASDSESSFKYPNSKSSSASAKTDDKSSGSSGSKSDDKNSPSSSNGNSKVSTKKNSGDHRRLTAASLYGADGSWYSMDGYGTYYDISSSDGSTLYYSGSLCDNDAYFGGDSNARCDIVLPPGQYIWRVSGALDSHKDMVAWDFCDVYGGSTSELTFTMDANGKCSPLKVKLLYDIVNDHGGYLGSMDYASQQTSMVLEGSLLLRGLQSSVVAPEDYVALKDAIAQEFSQVSGADSDYAHSLHETVSIVSWTPLSMDRTHMTNDLPQESAATRILGRTESMLAASVKFQVTLKAEMFGVDGTVDDEVNNLVQDVKAFLQSSSMGAAGHVFVARLVAAANAFQSTNLLRVNSVELSELVVLRANSSQELYYLLCGAVGFLILLSITVFITKYTRACGVSKSRDGHRLVGLDLDSSQRNIRHSDEMGMLPGSMHMATIHRKLTSLERGGEDDI